MSQTDRRTLSVQLLPMSVPNPPPVGGAAPSLATWGALANTETSMLPSLCLCPGEVGELLVRLVHQGDRPLRYSLQINGSIPPSWYRFYTEGLELQPNQAAEAVVRFQPEANFFEARQVLQPDQTLTLDYQAELRVQALAAADSSLESFTASDDPSELLASKPFYLFLRPRSLYPEFLPAVYQEVDFIGRLLKVFEQSFEPAVNTWQTLWAYLDPLTAPESLLPFLAQWVGWQNEVTWSVEQQRSLIRRAMEIYRWRGTKRGLQLYLHLYTGLPQHDPTRSPEQQPIQIVSSIQNGLVLGKSDFGPNAILGGGRPFHFNVTLRPNQGQFLDELLVRSIIDQEKPAVCTYDLAIAPIEDLVHV
ncbi:phage tail protein [Leptolyngbyaceae cyanobacterium UHCC 1019]